MPLGTMRGPNLVCFVLKTLFRGSDRLQLGWFLVNFGFPEFWTPKCTSQMPKVPKYPFFGILRKIKNFQRRRVGTPYAVFDGISISLDHFFLAYSCHPLRSKSRKFRAGFSNFSRPPGGHPSPKKAGKGHNKQKGAKRAKIAFSQHS